MKKWTLALVVSAVLLIGMSVFLRVGFHTLGEHGIEFYAFQRASKTGYAMRITPFRKMEVWPIGPTVHGGMHDGETIFRIGR